VRRIGDYSLKRFGMRADDFAGTVKEVIGLRIAVRQNMETMAAQARREMTQLRDEFVGIARKLRIEADLAEVQKELESRAGKVRDDVTPVLTGIAAAECVCFLGFFCAKRKTTSGFNKRD
jgi:hypothetical protein